ncbi:hypothetical protein GOP47_0028872 [Adiantum capillus-veneris]|nr:hypothetical protein GOP47_0028872 [Adiantum capillus-veneris]
MLDLLWSCNRAMRPRECPSKMHSRRIALRRHVAEEPFDKCTSEYYSGRKGVQGRKFVQEFAPQSLSNSMYIADAPGKGDVHGHSLTLFDSDGMDVLGADVDGKGKAREMHWSQEDGFLDQSIEHGKVNALPIDQQAEDKQAKFDACYSGSEPLPLFASSVDESDGITPGVNEMGSNVSVSRGSDCVHGFSSQRGLPTEEEEEETNWGVSMPAFSLSPPRGGGGHGRTFPPPLSSVATQSYSDKLLGQSPGACSAGFCLRSFRCNGRFVLQEVKAPTHKYFRVLRGDGRLKLELVNAENDTSAEEEEEEDEASESSDVCVGVENSDSVREMVCTSKVCAETASVGSSHTSMTLYAEGTCVASSQVEKLMPLDCRAAGIAIEGCGKANDLAGNPSLTNVELKRKPLICAVPEALTTPGTRAIASSESPSSPRCVEIRALYSSGLSPRMKSTWVRPISAF